MSFVFEFTFIVFCKSIGHEDFWGKNGPLADIVILFDKWGLELLGWVAFREPSQAANLRSF